MCRKRHRTWSAVLAVALLALAIAASGCDVREFFSSNWSFNIYIPLGLASNSSRSDYSAASIVPSLDTANSTGSINVPVLGNLASPSASTGTPNT